MNLTSIQQLVDFLSTLAPQAYQEGYDNAGLIVGYPATEITGVLLALDCTENVVAEAVRRGCNVVVAHHPIVFRGLKKLNGKNYVERTVMEAIRANVALYAIHTNLDHVAHGVNAMIAERLGLGRVRVLAPKRQLLMKLTYFVPSAEAQPVLDALFAAGAGQIGKYSECSFQSTGEGTFKPGDGTNPYLGESGKLERVAEQRVEVLFPAFLETKIMRALRQAHPYEEVAYYLHLLENEHQEVGAGAIGELPEPMTKLEFLGYLKEKMNVNVIKYTSTGKPTVQRVAVCGGAGSFLLPNALGAQADAFITADFKYHEFFDAENKIMICDIGHYESEVFTKQLLFNHISKKFDNFALYLSEVNTNPVSYFY
ncbi:Nif3-like dinuclear metal center hexameric protein [Salmonirosea aquatica]|uniref:GTP cyclohydrolase 1 type 2 homolog n=1 Tax=Salmonirosea aquatica TaxID=2654236 RepID=A0A7C9FB93_9BACT|nr:Nif3-like dinuclear metal center hexameric protein [Cytophagaceae bacterium SJW1-29]